MIIWFYTPDISFVQIHLWPVDIVKKPAKRSSPALCTWKQDTTKRQIVRLLSLLECIHAQGKNSPTEVIQVTYNIAVG